MTYNLPNRSPVRSINLFFISNNLGGHPAAASRWVRAIRRKCRNPFSNRLLSRSANGRKIHMNGHVAKLATASSFGIALLGLYFMFTTTNNTQLSLSACAMYIVGTVVGVLLVQSNK